LYYSSYSFDDNNVTVDWGNWYQYGEDGTIQKN
jgi:hypothetical protein